MKTSFKLRCRAQTLWRLSCSAGKGKKSALPQHALQRGHLGQKLLEDHDQRSDGRELIEPPLLHRAPDR